MPLPLPPASAIIPQHRLSRYITFRKAPISRLCRLQPSADMRSRRADNHLTAYGIEWRCGELGWRGKRSGCRRAKCGRQRDRPARQLCSRTAAGSICGAAPPRHGQSRLPQVDGAPQPDQGSRRKALVPAAILPDLNPIEQAFAKIKHSMRKAQKRTIEDTWRHIGYLVTTVKPDECENYFANAGYASVKS